MGNQYIELAKDFTGRTGIILQLLEPEIIMRTGN